jgi:hypothetical protein
MENNNKYHIERLRKFFKEAGKIDTNLPMPNEDDLNMAAFFCINPAQSWKDYAVKIGLQLEPKSYTQKDKTQMRLFYDQFYNFSILMRKAIAIVYHYKLFTSECHKCLSSDRVKCVKETSQCGKYHISRANIGRIADIFLIDELIDEDDNHVSPQEETLDISKIPRESVLRGSGRDADRVFKVKEDIVAIRASPNGRSHLRELLVFITENI